METTRTHKGVTGEEAEVDKGTSEEVGEEEEAGKKKRKQHSKRKDHRRALLSQSLLFIPGCCSSSLPCLVPIGPRRA